MKPELKYFIMLFSLVFLIPISAQNNQNYSAYSLFSDQKGSQTGDAITILVVESSLASNQSETAAGKKSEIGFNADGSVNSENLANVDLGLGSNNNFSGQGLTKSSGMIRTKISATVDSVMRNGNLYIRGSKKIVINGEEQTMSIKGIVRSADIMSDNSVLSYHISDAEIVFQGNGLIDNAQKPGWLTRFFHWLF